MPASLQQVVSSAAGPHVVSSIGGPQMVSSGGGPQMVSSGGGPHGLDWLGPMQRFVPPEAWGITLAQLQAIAQHPQFSAALTVRAVVDTIIVPATAKTGTGYALLHNAASPLRATVYVSHGWDLPFLELLAALEASGFAGPFWLFATSAYHVEDFPDISVSKLLMQNLGPRRCVLTRVLTKVQVVLSVVSGKSNPFEKLWCLIELGAASTLRLPLFAAAAPGEAFSEAAAGLWTRSISGRGSRGDGFCTGQLEARLRADIERCANGYHGIEVVVEGVRLQMLERSRERLLQQATQKPRKVAPAVMAGYAVTTLQPAVSEKVVEYQLRGSPAAVPAEAIEYQLRGTVPEVADLPPMPEVRVRPDEEEDRPTPAPSAKMVSRKPEMQEVVPGQHLPTTLLTGPYVPPELPATVPTAPGVEHLDPVTVQELMRQGACVLVDVRGQDRAAGLIEGAEHVPAIDERFPFKSRVPQLVQRYASIGLVIFTCQYSAHRAPTCANWYRDQAPGTQRVAILKGGFRHWERVGLPVQQMPAATLQAVQASDQLAVTQGLAFSQGQISPSQIPHFGHSAVS